jgi:type I restriction-modification system DNA methylase subunit
MSGTSKFNFVVSFLWAIADLLKGAFKKSEFQKIILSFTLLRRLGSTFYHTSQSLPRQRDIRRALTEADLVECPVALPGQLLESMQIPVCLWLIRKNEPSGKCRDVSELELDLAG